MIRGKFENVEIRGKEKKESKTGNSYILVRVEGDDGKTITLCDKDVSRYEYYKKGKLATLYISIDMVKTYTNIEITDMQLED